MSLPNVVTVQAPGSIGNFGPGLDVLGCAITGAADVVTVRRSDGAQISIIDPGAPELPSEANRHAAGLAVAAVLQRAGARVGLSISCHKGLPLAGGQGGSAASAVAAAVATNEILGQPLETNDLLACCLEAEAAVAGRHLDNIAPSLLGGIVLIRALDPIDVRELPIPRDLRIVLVLPEQRLATADARAALPRTLEREAVIHQMAQVAAIVHALHTEDLQLLGTALDDRIAEPARAGLIPGFREAKRAALDAGALGASISGAGPTTFALCRDDLSARRVALGMVAAFEAVGVHSTMRVAQVDDVGARVLPSEVA